MIALVEFAAANLDFVDTGRIGVTGHSLGGRIISNTLAHYGVAYEKALAQAQEPDSEGGYGDSGKRAGICPVPE